MSGPNTPDIAVSDASTNIFLEGALGSLCLRTALPIIFVMAMNGLLAVVDALLLGHYAGPQALAAVTLVFPVYMLIVALSTLVSSGMSSLLARHLGGRTGIRASGRPTGCRSCGLTSNRLKTGGGRCPARPGVPKVEEFPLGGRDGLAWILGRK